VAEDQTARVWDATSGQLLATLQGHTQGVRSAVFSSDSRHIVTASDRVRVWNAVSGQLLITLQGVSAVFSPDSQHIVTASDRVRVWDVTSGQPLATTTLQGGNDKVMSAVFSAGVLARRPLDRNRQ
jgi:WD40 repeat protein